MSKKILENVNIENDQENLKKHNLTEQIKKGLKLKDDMIQIRQNDIATYFDKLRANHKPKWDEVVKKGQSYYRGDQRGYDSWVSAMSETINLGMDWVECGPQMTFVSVGSFMNKMGLFNQSSREVLGFKFDMKVDDGKLLFNDIKRSDNKALTVEEGYAVKGLAIQWLEGKDYKHDDQGVFTHPKHGKLVASNVSNEGFNKYCEEVINIAEQSYAQSRRP